MQVAIIRGLVLQSCRFDKLRRNPKECCRCLSRESPTEEMEEKVEAVARRSRGRSKAIKDKKKIRALPHTQKLVKQVRMIYNPHARTSRAREEIGKNVIKHALTYARRHP